MTDATMRDGFWRAVLRVHRGLPGLPGTGEVHGSTFVGALADVRAGWPLGPAALPLLDSVPVAGFYAYGALWPQCLRAFGLPNDLAKIVKALEREFGTPSDEELAPWTMP